MRARLILLVLALLRPGPARAEPSLITVGIDVRQVDDATFRALDLLSLQRKLALRLTQSGFAVVAVERGPRIRIVLRVDGGQVTLEARADADVERRPAGAPAGDLASFHLELIHKAVEVARVLADRLPAAASLPAPTSRPTPASQPTTRPAPRPRPPRPPRPSETGPGLEAHLVGGGLYRVGGFDPVGRLDARLGGPRWAARASAGLVPSVHEDIGVLELTLQAGGSVRFALAAELQLEVALLAGLSSHIFWLTGDGAAESSGARFDFLGTLELELTWRVSGPVGLVGWLAPGLSEEGREHKLAGRTLWTRSAFRVGGGLGIVFFLL